MIVEIQSGSEERKIYFEVGQQNEEQGFKQGLVEAGAKENIKNTLEGIMDDIEYVAQKFGNKLSKLSPESTEIEFGVKIGVKGNVIFSSASSEVNFKIKLVWKGK